MIVRESFVQGSRALPAVAGWRKTANYPAQRIHYHLRARHEPVQLRVIEHHLKRGSNREIARQEGIGLDTVNRIFS